MTSSIHETDAIGEAARLWAIRVADPAFEDWDMLAAWLDGSPAHLAAYDAAVEGEAWATELFATPAPRMQPVAVEPRRRRFVSGGVALGVAMLAGFGGWIAMDAGGGPVTYATAPGERRTVELADGSRVVLNGATELVVAAGGDRQVSLTRGEALFDVRHDEARPFVVVAGGTRLLDLGTIFNVVRNEGRIDVAVAEGAVLYQANRRDVRLNAGDALTRQDASAEPVLRKAAPDTIGTWKAGYLHYDDAVLSTVAADLSRNLGKPVEVRGTMAGRRFSGTIMLDGSAEQVLARTGALVDARFVAGNKGWTMMPRDGAAR